MPTHRAIPCWPRIALFVLVIASGAEPAAAQQIRWLTDYNAARKEAAERGRPLLLDFGTDGCLWCKKQDLSTFRDGMVVSLLNDKFVAIRVDAERESALTQSLRITQFPTLVLAAPDGKILGVLEGYQEAPSLAERLQKVAAAYAPPEWMLRDYQEAAKAIVESDYTRAIALLKGITKDGKDRPQQVKARQVLHDLEQQATSRLTRAKILHDRGHSVEAADALAELLKTFAGTQAAADGATFLSSIASRPELREQQRGRRARELLALAKDDYRTQQYYGCLERCEILTSGYADLPEGGEAKQLAAEIKDNPELLTRACDSLNHRVGALYLTLAETWMKKGRPQEAQRCLERVVQSASGTVAAQLAELKLSQLRGETTYQTDYKKAP